MAFAGAADDFWVLEVFFDVLLTFTEEVDAFFVEIGDAFAVEVVLTEVVALLTTLMPSLTLACPAMMGYPTS